MSIIKINVPGFDNELAVKAESCHGGKMFKVSAAQIDLLLPDSDKSDLPVYFHECEVTQIKPILFRFTLSACDVIPTINTHHIVRAIREEQGALGPVYVVTKAELKAAGIPDATLKVKLYGEDVGRIMSRNTLPVKC